MKALLCQLLQTCPTREMVAQFLQKYDCDFETLCAESYWSVETLDVQRYIQDWKEMNYLAHPYAYMSVVQDVFASETTQEWVDQLDDSHWQEFWLHYCEPLTLLRIHHAHQPVQDDDEKEEPQDVLQIATPVLDHLSIVELWQRMKQATGLEYVCLKTELETRVLPSLQTYYTPERVDVWKHQIPTKEQIQELLQRYAIPLTVLTRQEEPNLAQLELEFLIQTHVAGDRDPEQTLVVARDPVTASSNLYFEQMKQMYEHKVMEVFDSVWNQLLLQLPNDQWREFFAEYVTPWGRALLNLLIEYLSTRTEQVLFHS